VRRHSPPAIVAVVAVVAVAAMALAACNPPGDETATGCAATVKDAALESEPSDQIRLLDRAMVICGSYDAFTTELRRYSGSIGYDPVTYTARRCENVDDDAVRTGPTCSVVIVPTTTAPPTTLVELLFVGDTVDGRPIEIRPGAGIEFVGEVPAIIQQTVDIALESGCEGVIAQRDLWFEQIENSSQGDVASVYAQHAQNVADFIGCDSDPISPEG
jgi:predicted small secreted protein